MKILERFLNSVDANLCASFLQNEGIDAEVFDDSAIGGDGLGAIRSSVRIVVPDGQLEAAREALKSYHLSGKGDEDA